MAMTCRLCGSTDVRMVLDLGMQPLANKYPAVSDFANEERHPLQVEFCLTCSNVQLGTIVSRKVMFEEYFYLSSVNGALVQHFHQLAQTLRDARFVVDIGSNDGILLKPLRDLGVRALGVEPSINVSRIANDLGLQTHTAFFDAACVDHILSHHETPDVIVASSVFTHLEDPHQFVESVKRLLAPDGTFLIEVEYIGNFLDSLQFERFYLDRVYYYSLTSLVHLFAQYDMTLTHVDHIVPHGGSLQVHVKHRSEDAVPDDTVRDQLAREREGLTHDAFVEFRTRIDAEVAKLRTALEGFKAAGTRVAGYGAPARVTTICNYGAIGPDLIEFIVDDSPLKQGKYSPGTHIPIVPRTHLDTHAIDVLIVFAYEYIDAIRESTTDSYTYYSPIPLRRI